MAYLAQGLGHLLAPLLVGVSMPCPRCLRQCAPDTDVEVHFPVHIAASASLMPPLATLSAAVLGRGSMSTSSPSSAGPPTSLFCLHCASKAYEAHRVDAAIPVSELLPGRLCEVARAMRGLGAPGQALPVHIAASTALDTSSTLVSVPSLPHLDCFLKWTVNPVDASVQLRDLSVLRPVPGSSAEASRDSSLGSSVCETFVNRRRVSLNLLVKFPVPSASHSLESGPTTLYTNVFHVLVRSLQNQLRVGADGPGSASGHACVVPIPCLGSWLLLSNQLCSQDLGSEQLMFRLVCAPAELHVAGSGPGSADGTLVHVVVDTVGFYRCPSDVVRAQCRRRSDSWLLLSALVTTLRLLHVSTPREPDPVEFTMCPSCCDVHDTSMDTEHDSAESAESADVTANLSVLSVLRPSQSESCLEAVLSSPALIPMSIVLAHLQHGVSGSLSCNSSPHHHEVMATRLISTTILPCDNVEITGPLPNRHALVVVDGAPEVEVGPESTCHAAMP